jgi:Ca2+-binding RTX toxin-like protein
VTARRVARALLIAPAIGLVLVSALTAGNAVPATRLGLSASAIAVDDLKPPDCSAITLTTLVVGTTGTAGNDLLIGTAGSDALSGGNGNDCILGGGGSDTFNGGSGTDVCIGGPGTDVHLLGCETLISIP